MYDLDMLSKTDLTTICKEDLKDISQIKIDTSLPLIQRKTMFLSEIKNPYCFLIGKSAVKIEFQDEGESLQNLLKKHFIEQRKQILD